MLHLQLVEVDNRVDGWGGGQAGGQRGGRVDEGVAASLPVIPHHLSANISTQATAVAALPAHSYSCKNPSQHPPGYGCSEPSEHQATAVTTPAH